MATPSTSPPAGGCLLALLPVVGAVIGLILQQPTIGFLVGLAIGVVGAIAIWLRGRG